MGDVARPEVDADGNAVIHGSPSSQSTQSSSAAAEQKKRGRKRKRLTQDAAAQASAFGFDRKEALAETWRREVSDLVRYFREELVPKAAADDVGDGTTQMVVAKLIEGSALSFPKLCAEIYASLQSREGVTLASLGADVQFVGGRVRYGVDNGRLDVAEDEDEACLWCWEARDVKLFPITQRPVVKVLREARKKVHGAIAAFSAGISAILKSGNQEEYATELRKAVQRIDQELGIADIRLMVEKSMLKNRSNLMEKEAKLKEKLTVKEAEKVEKEKLRAELELQKEKARNHDVLSCTQEKELKKQKEEAEKEEKRREKEERKQREKEELESQKQLKRQQDEGERERKRREKAESELKNKLSLKKQVNMMERFLKNKCPSVKSDDTELAEKPATMSQVTETVQTLVTNMDHLFSQDFSVTIEDIQKNQIGRWKGLCYSGRQNHWGVRVMPKLDVVKEIRLRAQLTLSKPVTNLGHDSGTQTVMTDSSCEKITNEAEDVIVIDDDVSGSDVAEVVLPPTELPYRVKKLLQFDKSHRPAYYGTWSKRSTVVGPRKPLNKDPTLDYDVDSDEEWEEEEPGESLTDCEKDDVDETEEVEANCEDDSEDSFVVPDGYLSESERGDADSPDTSNVNGDTESSVSCTTDVESEDFRILRQYNKYLGGLIEKALRRSQPLIISNLKHEKSEPGAVGDLNGTTKIEQICLQALTMQACIGASTIELQDLDVSGEICEVPSQSSVPASVPLMDNSVLADVIATIRSCPGGINKVVDILHQKFPAFSRTYMKNKVKEIADYNFVESQWKIKREVTDRLGLSPERVKKTTERIKKTKGISAFFSKRCLPPSEAKEVTEISPLQLKSLNFPRDAVVACELNQQSFDMEDS